MHPWVTNQSDNCHVTMLFPSNLFANVVFIMVKVNVVALFDVESRPNASLSAGSFTHSAERSERGLASMKHNRGCGRDAIPAELLQSSSAAAAKLHEIQTRIVEQEHWPTSWAGGSIVDAYKRKGAIENCDNSRGLLLSDHAGKSFSGTCL